VRAVATRIDDVSRHGGLRIGCLVVARGLGFLLCVVALVLAARPETLAAQQEPAVKDESVPTLHVYTDLIQIPVLVLDPQQRPLKKRIAENRFSVSIDSGPWFQATHVRQEGDDPISLSILLDVSGDGENLMPKIADAIAGLVPEGLHAKDHVSIYALDCSLVQSLNDEPAESGRMKVAVDEALQSWTIRKEALQPANCQQSIHLWDALAQTVGGLKGLPGRRVILAVSNGRDQGSHRSWNEVRYLAEAAGVAVFGVTYVPFEAEDEQDKFLMWSSEDPFLSVCELSGGMRLLSTPKSLVFTLERFVTLVRERYIVEFPRPANSTVGLHSQEMRIAKSKDFIRPSGVSYPIPDPSVLADPTTVPSDPSRTPVVGTRKPMKTPQ
jgi:hypothetical protein